MSDDNPAAIENEVTNSQEDLKERLVTWRTVSIAAGAVVAILGALGPCATWNNGNKDRLLQKEKIQDEISLRYMDLLLKRSGTERQREMTLNFLVSALSAERPRDLMLEHASEELGKIEIDKKLREEIKGSEERVRTLEAQTIAYTQRTDELSNAQSFPADESASMLAELEAERVNRRNAVQELSKVRKEESTLREMLEEARGAAGLSSTAEVSKDDGDFLSDLGIPLQEQELLRSLDSTCRYHNGQTTFLYRGPNDPIVTCRIGSESALLDESTVAPLSSIDRRRMVGLTAEFPPEERAFHSVLPVRRRPS